MRTLIALLSCCIAVGVSAQPSHNVKADLAALTDPAKMELARIRLYELGKSDPQTYALLSDRLPVMLLQAKDMFVVQNEATLAGWLKINGTIPSLIQLLRYRNYHGDGGLTDRIELRTDPIARARYEIGKPALPALAKALNSDSRDVRSRVDDILFLTDTPESRAILKKHLSHEPDGELYANINGYLRRHDNS
jgi:hypothetical protein